MSGTVEQLFAGRALGVATQHGKERAVGPAFLERLTLGSCRAIPGLDTDRFGAFSGERPRTLSPSQAAEAKARAGAESSGLDLVVASEGSFGPHPTVPLLTCDEEWLVLLDLATGVVRRHHHLSTEAVWDGRACSSLDALREFALRLPFPAHRLVLRPHRHWSPGDVLHKGISSHARLEEHAQALLTEHGSLWAEVDLRAHANPTRMQVIARAAREFADELATPCPVCGAAYFRVVEAVRGLPCAECLAPTRSTLGLRRACDPCGHTAASSRPDGRSQEDPTFCDACNP
jgi:hypothetical protein